jgi:hypothetical protein
MKFLFGIANMSPFHIDDVLQLFPVPHGEVFLLLSNQMEQNHSTSADELSSSPSDTVLTPPP